MSYALSISHESVKKVEKTEEEREADAWVRINAFHGHLERDYGSVMVAWRRLFDANGDGFVSCKEFMEAVAPFPQQPTLLGHHGRLEKQYTRFKTQLCQDQCCRHSQ